MEDGLIGQLGLVAVKFVAEELKTELGIAPIQNHHWEDNIVLDPVPTIILATMIHAYMVKITDFFDSLY